MKLPNAEQAWIHPDKILKYLLSDIHETGGPKAAFFKRFGFSEKDWTLFDAALRRHARENDVTRTIESPNGTKYVLEGPLHTPDGRTPYVRTIWMIKWNMTVARLISAYPLGSDDVLQEHDIIVLTEDLPSTKFKAGDIGTIVYLSDDSPYYEIEFMTREGDTIDIVTVHASQVRPVNSMEVMVIRALE